MIQGEYADRFHSSNCHLFLKLFLLRWISSKNVNENCVHFWSFQREYFPSPFFVFTPSSGIFLSSSVHLHGQPSQSEEEGSFPDFLPLQRLHPLCWLFDDIAFYWSGMGMESSFSSVSICMGGYALLGNFLFRVGLSFLVFCSGGKGFEYCGNVSLFDTLYYIDRGLSSIE